MNAATRKWHLFLSFIELRGPDQNRILMEGTVKYYAQIHLQVWQNSVCTGQGNLPLIT